MTICKHGVPSWTSPACEDCQEEFREKEASHERHDPSWEPQVRYVALASNVLVVARTRVEGTWAAYCDAVPGLSHRQEWQDVLDSGCKLGEPIARALFPIFKDTPYAH